MVGVAACNDERGDDGAENTTVLSREVGVSMRTGSSVTLDLNPFRFRVVVGFAGNTDVSVLGTDGVLAICCSMTTDDVSSSRDVSFKKDLNLLLAPRAERRDAKADMDYPILREACVICREEVKSDEMTLGEE